MKDFLSRFVFSIVVVCFIAILLYLANLEPIKLFISFLIAVIASVAVWEYTRLTKVKQIVLSLPWMIVSTLLQVIAFYYLTEFLQWRQLPILLFTLMLIPLFYFQFRQIEGAMQRVSLSIVGIILFVVPLAMLLPILYFPPTAGDGRVWLAFLLIVVKIGDIGGYVGGKLLGGKKLANKLSPNKTYSGAIVGLLCSLLTSLVFYWSRFYFNEGQIELTLVDAIALGAILGILGQFSDLMVSLFKRDAGVKNSNKIPAIGGVLDMVDSLLLPTPLLYFFLF